MVEKVVDSVQEGCARTAFRQPKVKSMKYPKLIAIGLLVIFAAAMISPTAMAQRQPASFVIDSVSQLSGDIVPDIKPQQTTVSWTYTVTGQVAPVGQAESTSAVLTWKKPTCTSDQIIVTGPGTQLIPITTTSNTVRVEDEAKFTLSATTEAPGEQTLSCRFEGSVGQVGQSIEAAGASAQDLQFSVAYYGLIQATSAGRLKEAGPQKPVSYDITVTNFGNARTAVAFKLGSEESGSWKPILPEPMILESKVSGQGGDVQTATFQINTPYKNGWNNDERTFKVILTPTSAKSGAEGGNPVEVNVLARVRGVYVPTLEPMIMVGAILGTALLARMRREE